MPVTATNFILAAISGLALLACSAQRVTKFDLGTNGTVTATIDQRGRVREFAHITAENVVRARGHFEYSEHGFRTVRFVDGQGRELCRNEFKETTISTMCQPGFEFQTGPHDITEWRLDKAILFQDVRKQTDDGRFVHDVFGPHGLTISSNVFY
jgi:hypothetical protein